MENDHSENPANQIIQHEFSKLGAMGKKPWGRSHGLGPIWILLKRLRQQSGTGTGARFVFVIKRWGQKSQTGQIGDRVTQKPESDVL